MILFDADISDSVFFFLKRSVKTFVSTKNTNETFQKVCGVKFFFENDTDLLQLREALNQPLFNEVREDRTEYGDFQTNQSLALKITKHLKANGTSPQVVIEPTCGKGNFILAVLNTFDHVEKIYGIEIQRRYIWQAKFNILDFFLNNPDKKTPEVQIIQSSIFNYNYRSIKEVVGNKELLIIGNPPWVTNATLGTLDAKNLPQKSNFKQHKGLDAKTGKGNFDIAEYITIDLLKNFGTCNGTMAFLVKNTVIRNILYDLPKQRLPIATLKKQNIDSKKKIDVNVDASLFLCRLNHTTEYQCQESDFYTTEIKKHFGWAGGKFMSDISHGNNAIDGISPFEWRQGIKHDCSKVMEIINEEGRFSNKIGEHFEIEADMVYPLLKSSDLKSSIAARTTKMIIVTQKTVGQNTSYIRQYPQTFEYLNRHIDLFRQRKSSIYKGKCDFSIFGIGDYSFKPYKIAISGLYKTFHFCLIQPQDGKPVMLDDTCYFIGFDNLEQAKYIWNPLNTDTVATFLKSISFIDAKRMITKEVLMRIDLRKLALSKDEDVSFLHNTSTDNNLQLSIFD